MKVRQLAASPTHTKRTDGETVVTEHLLIVTMDGRVFERFSDDTPGVWHEVPLPRERKATTAKRVSKRQQKAP